MSAGSVPAGTERTAIGHSVVSLTQRAMPQSCISAASTSVPTPAPAKRYGRRVELRQMRAFVLSWSLASLALASSWLSSCTPRPRPERERMGASEVVDARDFPDARAVVLLDRTE